MTSRRLAQVAAALLVITAALFVIGVAVERSDHHSEPAGGHAEGSEEAPHDEAGGHVEASHNTSELDHGGDEKVLGLDLEAAPLVAVAVLASLAIAAGLRFLAGRGIAAVAAAFALVLAVLDVAELAHQLDESKTGLALLAAVIALGHLVAGAASARVAIRPEPQELTA